MNLSKEFLSNAGNFFSKIAWGAGVMQQVNSPRVGIVYDIYHAQVAEGNIVQAIRNNIKWINHFHTAGNPGRNQLDDNQELNYRFIARAIAELNFDGYVAHEYKPTDGADPAACLKQAFETFNVWSAPGARAGHLRGGRYFGSEASACPSLPGELGLWNSPGGVKR